MWYEWLQVHEARSDPGYSAIESVVRKFIPDTENKSARKSTASKKKIKKKRRKD